ncbi:MAG: hypothetical protein M3O02_04400 [Acidobacteriota bacterium]|nr:hypothetical protein [Acidobacteriota bacterium]
MTTANAKGIVVKAVLGFTAMGAFLLGGAVKAQAQHLAVAVQFGTPYGGGYYNDRREAYGYRDHDRDWDRADDRRREAYQFELRQEAIRREQYEEHERREAIERHEQWERAHRAYGWDRDDRWER